MTFPNDIPVSDFRENLMSVSSMDKDTFSTIEPKWDVIAPALNPDLAASAPLNQKSQPVRTRPQSFAQKLRSTGKSVKGKLGRH